MMSLSLRSQPNERPNQITDRAAGREGGEMNVDLKEGVEEMKKEINKIPDIKEQVEALRHLGMAMQDGYNGIIHMGLADGRTARIKDGKIIGYL
jgi:hypothetical protein